MTDELDQELRGMFASEPLVDGRDDSQFVAEVMQRAQKVKRVAMLKKLVVMVVLAIIAIPLQDFALAVGQILIIQLVDIERGLAGQLLAPVNSVGTLLGTVLLVLRASYKRLLG